MPDIVVSDTYGEISKAPGVDIHVRLVTVDDLKFVDLREFITDTGKYAHGVLIPMDILLTVTAYAETAYVASRDPLPLGHG